MLHELPFVMVGNFGTPRRHLFLPSPKFRARALIGTALLHSGRLCYRRGRRRMRRRARVFTSVRTATRNFDLELATATLRLHTQLYVEIETIPVVYGGNRAGLSRRGQGAWQLGASRRMGRICDRTIPLQARIFGMSEKPKFHSKMIKDGRWTVAIRTGYGPVSHVGNFATEEEANRWIAIDSKNWPKPADNQSES
jgi:hypothetical protein